MSNKNNNIISRLQKWMDSIAGKTFLNYAYSWGAAVVILGTLFKLTHLPMANVMLFVGMGTEVFVFFIWGFDRPFDVKEAEKDDETEEDEEKPQKHNAPNMAIEPLETGAGNVSIQIGDISDTVVEKLQNVQTTASEHSGADVAEALSVLRNPDWLQQQAQISPEMVDAQSRYVSALNTLTEMLTKVSEQSERLTKDSQEMENLNRTLTSICKIYEMQLKSASSQVSVIDQINEQTRKMASQIEQLNQIYNRMIEAMTANMNIGTKNN
ncbi:MAG: gliding motility protein GldL [Prevotella sp.]|nr:gliding motility protein GldL [Prevotella sp.]